MWINSKLEHYDLILRRILYEQFYYISYSSIYKTQKMFEQRRSQHDN